MMWSQKKGPYIGELGAKIFPSPNERCIYRNSLGTRILKNSKFFCPKDLRKEAKDKLVRFYEPQYSGSRNFPSPKEPSSEFLRVPKCPSVEERG